MIEGSFKIVKEESDKVKRRLIESLPEMEKRAGELRSQIQSIDDEIKQLIAKKEPLQKEESEVLEELINDVKMDLPLLVKYQLTKDKVKSIIDKVIENDEILKSENFSFYIQEDVVGIRIIFDMLPAKTLCEIVSQLVVESNIPEKRFAICQIEVLRECRGIELFFSSLSELCQDEAEPSFRFMHRSVGLILALSVKGEEPAWMG